MRIPWPAVPLVPHAVMLACVACVVCAAVLPCVVLPCCRVCRVCSHNLPLGRTMCKVIKERAPKIWKTARKEMNADKTWLTPSDAVLFKQKEVARKQGAQVKQWLRPEHRTPF